MGAKVKLIMNLITLTVTTLLLVFTIFAWYVTNSNVSVSGVTGVTANSNYVHFKEDVIAKRTSLNGVITTYTYSIGSGGTLILKRIDYSDSTPSVTTFAEEQYFNIAELLPGEYVDVTIGYYMDSVMNGKPYTIRLDKINGDTFTVDQATHSAAGAFKYKSMSLKDEANKNVADYNITGYIPDVSDTWFDTYTNRVSDIYPTYRNTLEHTWNNSYTALYYTFRITEDFSQYYRLIGQAEESVDRLLSNKNFYIGHVFIMI